MAIFIAVAKGSEEVNCCRAPEAGFFKEDDDIKWVHYG